MKLELISHDGNKAVFAHLKKTSFNTKKGLKKAFHKVGISLKREFRKQVLAKNKTGRLYVIKGRLHKSSAADETPANRTGNYQRKIGFSVSGGEQLIFGNSAKYAGYLEGGTTRMKLRPGLHNTIQTEKRDIIRTITEQVKNEIG